MVDRRLSFWIQRALELLIRVRVRFTKPTANHFASGLQRRSEHGMPGQAPRNPPLDQEPCDGSSYQEREGIRPRAHELQCCGILRDPYSPRSQSALVCGPSPGGVDRP